MSETAIKKLQSDIQRCMLKKKFWFFTIENNISILLTRNLKDFKKATIPVMTPQQYLKSSD
jgi:hypothetical protein